MPVGEDELDEAQRVAWAGQLSHPLSARPGAHHLVAVPLVVQRVLASLRVQLGLFDAAGHVPVWCEDEQLHERRLHGRGVGQHPGPSLFVAALLAGLPCDDAVAQQELLLPPDLHVEAWHVDERVVGGRPHGALPPALQGELDGLHPPLGRHRQRGPEHAVRAPADLHLVGLLVAAHRLLEPFVVLLVGGPVVETFLAQSLLERCDLFVRSPWAQLPVRSHLDEGARGCKGAIALQGVEQPGVLRVLRRQIGEQRLQAGYVPHALQIGHQPSPDIRRRVAQHQGDLAVGRLVLWRGLRRGGGGGVVLVGRSGWRLGRVVIRSARAGALVGGGLVGRAGVGPGGVVIGREIQLGPVAGDELGPGGVPPPEVTSVARQSIGQRELQARGRLGLRSAERAGLGEGVSQPWQRAVGGQDPSHQRRRRLLAPQLALQGLDHCSEALELRPGGGRRGRRLGCSGLGERLDQAAELGEVVAGRVQRVAVGLLQLSPEPLSGGQQAAHRGPAGGRARAGVHGLQHLDLVQALCSAAELFGPARLQRLGRVQGGPVQLGETARERRQEGLRVHPLLLCGGHTGRGGSAGHGAVAGEQAPQRGPQAEAEAQHPQQARHAGAQPSGSRSRAPLRCCCVGLRSLGSQGHPSPSPRRPSAGRHNEVVVYPTCNHGAAAGPPQLS